MPCTEIGSEWAAQRIQNLSLGCAMWRAVLPRRNDPSIKTLIDRFEYPRLGPGQMWERCQQVVERRGAQVLLGREATKIRHASGRVTAVTLRETEGRLQELPATHVLSSSALPDVARALEQIGLASWREVSDGMVARMRRAYPVYDAGYQEAVATIRSYLETLPNLQQVGRNGQHRYNNQDHSMLTAMLAVRNVLGERH